ncbi:MAG: GNAT family N-acetyltransferase [Acidobacteriota bacterium]
MTERLVLRPFTLADAPAVQRLAGAREIALNTLLIPYPYPEGAAEAWISKPRDPNDINFAITLRESGELVGAIGLVVGREHDRAEIGYWIAVEHWNRGYATEAARAVIRYGFEELNLNRIFAVHFARNAGSGRVMQKLGMRHEGSLREHLVKWGERIDVELYGILRGDWL